MIAYFDTFCGISGDMALGAFVDCGVPVGWLNERISLLNLPVEIRADDVKRNGIAAKKVVVKAKKEDQPHRHYRDIKELIKKSGLGRGPVERSLRVFGALAAAEAKIHGVGIDQVHFHEAGAADSIVDIVGVCLCMEYLGITRVLASYPKLGSGFVECGHGRLPVPAPATLELLRGVPVEGIDVNSEITTPTGAAILAGLCEEFGPFPQIMIDSVGYGAGSRIFDNVPNLLRIVIGRRPERAIEDDGEEKIVMVETNIDDMNPEILGHVVSGLLENGALDVWMVPVYMKKNRPGTMIQAICDFNEKERIMDMILKQTTTLGVRYFPVNRRSLPRKKVILTTAFGKITAKAADSALDTVRILPEFESVKEVAIKKGVPLLEVYHAAVTAAVRGEVENEGD